MKLKLIELRTGSLHCLITCHDHDKVCYEWAACIRSHRLDSKASNRGVAKEEAEGTGEPGHQAEGNSLPFFVEA